MLHEHNCDRRALAASKERANIIRLFCSRLRHCTVFFSLDSNNFFSLFFFWLFSYFDESKSDEARDWSCCCDVQRNTKVLWKGVRVRACRAVVCEGQRFMLEHWACEQPSHIDKGPRTRSFMCDGVRRSAKLFGGGRSIRFLLCWFYFIFICATLVRSGYF